MFWINAHFSHHPSVKRSYLLYNYVVLCVTKNLPNITIFYFRFLFTLRIKIKVQHFLDNIFIMAANILLDFTFREKAFPGIQFMNQKVSTYMLKNNLQYIYSITHYIYETKGNIILQYIIKQVCFPNYTFMMVRSGIYFEVCIVYLHDL